MTILRGATPTDRVVSILRAAAQDTRLSYRARGLLVAVMSRPKDWRTDYRQLAAEAREGERAVLHALRELEDLGYLRRTKVHDGKRIRTDWEISDLPRPTGRRFLQPTKLQPTKLQPTKLQPLLEGETEGDTPPPTASTPTAPGQDLVVVVAQTIPKTAAPAARVLARECARLAGQGWTPDQLQAAARAHDWTGARAGAVVAWLRDPGPPPAAPQAPVERPTWCGACDQTSRRILDAHGRPRRGTHCPTCGGH